MPRGNKTNYEPLEDQDDNNGKDKPLKGVAGLMQGFSDFFTVAFSDIYKICESKGDNVRLLRKFLEGMSKKELREKAHGQFTVLDIALTNRNYECAKALIEAGADVNQKSYGGDTPLHVAANSGNPDVIKLLIERGAKCDAKDDRGRTPFGREHTKDLAYLAQQKPASVSTESDSQTTTVHHRKGYGN